MTGEEETPELKEIEDAPTIFAELARGEVPKPSHIQEAEEAVDLARQVKEGKISISELPRDLRHRLGYVMPGETIFPFGFPMYFTEPTQVVEPEAREYMLKSP
ncbi:MAG: hypothetical protein GTO54_09730, partial [Nitrososphaeria archaeon]|nr:hypothetical protein [Nitrososphaeria archaeon]